VSALDAFAGGVILKKLHGMTALGAFFIKNGTGFPVSAVLAGAFHGFSPLFFF
jgi:hypothetical protein